jgi:hypothetical protein
MEKHFLVSKTIAYVKNDKPESLLSFCQTQTHTALARERKKTKKLAKNEREIGRVRERGRERRIPMLMDSLTYRQFLFAN